MQITTLGALAVDGRPVRGDRLVGARRRAARRARPRRVVGGARRGRVGGHPARRRRRRGAGARLARAPARARRRGGARRLPAADRRTCEIDVVDAEALLDDGRGRAARRRRRARAQDLGRPRPARCSRRSPTWTDPATAHLLAEVVTLRAEAGLALGDVDDVVDDLRRCALRTPPDEPLVALLVRVLAAQGRDAEALEVVERVRAELADRYGTDPSPVVAQAHLALLRGELAADAAAAPAAAARTRRPARRLAPPRDRAGRPRRRRRARSRPRSTTAPLVTIVATGGAGKTRLAAEVARRAVAAGRSVRVVELAGLRAPAEVLPTVLAAIGGVGRDRRARGPDHRAAAADPRGPAAARGAGPRRAARARQLRARARRRRGRRRRPARRRLARRRRAGDEPGAAGPRRRGRAPAADAARRRRARAARDAGPRRPGERRLGPGARARAVPPPGQPAARARAGRRTAAVHDRRGRARRPDRPVRAARRRPARAARAAREPVGDGRLEPRAAGPGRPRPAAAARGHPGAVHRRDRGRRGRAASRAPSAAGWPRSSSSRCSRSTSTTAGRRATGCSRPSASTARRGSTPPATAPAAMAGLVRWAAAEAGRLADGLRRRRAARVAFDRCAQPSRRRFVAALRWAVDHDDEAGAVDIASALFHLWSVRGAARRGASSGRRGSCTPTTRPRAGASALFQRRRRRAAAARRRPARLGRACSRPSTPASPGRSGSSRSRGGRIAAGARRPARARCPRGCAALAVALPALGSSDVDVSLVAAAERMIASDDPYLHGLGPVHAGGDPGERRRPDACPATTPREAYRAFEAIGDHWGMGMAAQGVGQWEGARGGARRRGVAGPQRRHLELVGATQDVRSIRVLLDVQRALAGDDGRGRAAARGRRRPPQVDDIDAAQAHLGLAHVAWQAGRVDEAIDARRGRDRAGRRRARSAMPQARVVFRVAAAVAPPAGRRRCPAEHATRRRRPRRRAARPAAADALPRPATCPCSARTRSACAELAALPRARRRAPASCGRSACGSAPTSCMLFQLRPGRLAAGRSATTPRREALLAPVRTALRAGAGRRTASGSSTADAG